MFNEYSEDSLIEKPAIEIFKSLGYSYLNCFDETFGQNSTLGRETSSDVVLMSRLKPALVNLNPKLPQEAINKAIEIIISDRSILNPAVANKEFYKLIKEGVKVSYRNKSAKGGDEEVEEVVKVIDFENPDENDFFLASQFWVTGDLYKRRPDLIGFVNGLPLILIELKGTHRKLENAYYDNLKDYKDTIPQIFWFNAFVILSNGSESKVGTLTLDWEHFAEWKKINSEGEQGVVSLDTIIKGTCEKKKFLDLLENFILFQDTGGKQIKIFSKNHQYLGVNNAIEQFRQIEKNKGRLGVFWHTQGSGKSFSMIFFSQKILRKFGGNYTFIIVTDRKELDVQIYKNFLSCGAVTEIEVHAESRNHLRQLLKENHRNIFTLIHKFGLNTGENLEVLSDRSDIIVITDEAHRSQYDTLALNMRSALPNAAFIAFTGTPLIVGEEKTKETFGDYISVYDFRQSVDDNATVPLYYENRIPELQLEDKDLFNEKIQDIVEKAELTPEEENRLEREFAREYHLITRDDRLNRVAEDIVEHFISRGFRGKGMVVCIDKPTAVKMYQKVKALWDLEIKELESVMQLARDEKEKELDQVQLNYLKETDMTVVVSPEQNEIDKFRKLGLDIETHRRRMVKEDLDEKFKDPDNPFRLVFVCAMWMTGFDAPSVSTIYLDKPMKNHTLMQTIARANRVFKEKPNGLIVDYIGVFRNLQKALAIYGIGGRDREGALPVKPKDELIKDLRNKLSELKNFCLSKEVDLYAIIDAGALNNIRMIGDAVDKLLENDSTKSNYLNLANAVYVIFKAILPDPKVSEFQQIVRLIKVIADKMRSFEGPVDISQVMKKVEDVLDESVKAEQYIISDTKPLDLSKIDFESLKKMFEKSRKNTQAERLKNALKAKVFGMVMMNKHRVNYAEMLQEMIDEYNSGTINVEQFFDKLMKFAKELNEEDQRSIKENLTEEELAIFDLLKQPKLSAKEKNKVKSAAKELLVTLKASRLVLDWRKRQQTRANVQLTIQQILDKGLPTVYSPDIFQSKCDRVYEHIYENYFGDGRSIYS
ncbi:MAG: type I restriction endonuclease subunit R [Ignavibacteriaceae bacterium]|nr:type I restriction endonuclease subunit R [Ignavibacteriaceae bacterium]